MTSSPSKKQPSDFFECTSSNEQAQQKDVFMKNELTIVQDARFEMEFGKYPVLYVDFSVCELVIVVFSVLMSGGWCTEYQWF
jgi:hypothetical protein